MDDGVENEVVDLATRRERVEAELKALIEMAPDAVAEAVRNILRQDDEQVAIAAAGLFPDLVKKIIFPTPQRPLDAQPVYQALMEGLAHKSDEVHQRARRAMWHEVARDYGKIDANTFRHVIFNRERGRPQSWEKPTSLTIKL